MDIFSFIDIDLNIIESAGTILLVIDWAIRTVALFIVPRNRKPTAGMAWLMLIFLAPIIGIITYIIFGNPKLPKSRQDTQKIIDGFIQATVKDFQRSRDKMHILDAKVPDKYLPIAKLSESLGGLPVFSGNQLELMPNYDDAIKSIVSDIDSAKKFVQLEYFIFTIDETTLPIFDALARAVKRGVIARVMYDSLSTRHFPNHRQMKKRLISDGVFVQPLLPFRLPGFGYVRPDLRNHRKIVVIDGEVGYTGSQNIIKRNYHRKDEIYYDEMVVRMKGPIVLQLAAVFLTDWYSETGTILDYRGPGYVPSEIKSYGSSLSQVLPSGPGYEDENNLKLFTSLIHLAQRRIVIVNPYFVPDDALSTAITSAAKRGVEVTMINSEAIDQWLVGHAQRSFYETFLRAGVKIHLYKAPILLHSKFIVVDDDIATVGSSNLDIRSFLLNLEVTLITYDHKVVAEFNKMIDQYLQNSTKIEINEWLKRTKFQNLKDNIARLTSALQ